MSLQLKLKSKSDRRLDGWVAPNVEMHCHEMYTLFKVYTKPNVKIICNYLR